MPCSRGLTGSAAGERDAATVRAVVADMIDAAPHGELDYVEVADASTLAPVDVSDSTTRLFAAVRFGRARLIDNVGADDPAARQEPAVDVTAVDVTAVEPESGSTS